MNVEPSVIEGMRRRYSCRRYLDRTIEPGLKTSMEAFLGDEQQGPLGSKARFQLIAASEGDTDSLKGLGTYGLIKKATGFIVGAVEKGPKDLEDFGYLMERAILKSTELGLGTCWLGGIFSKSNFAKRLGLTEGEIMPAIAATGYADEAGRGSDLIRKGAGSDRRLPEASLFFDGAFGQSLTKEASGPYQKVFEMVRWAPSASNRQPWRVVKTGTGWHLYLARNKNYGKGTLIFSLLRIADLQRVDMGIAMCHLELSARELGLKGDWVLDDPGLLCPDRTEYTITWRPSI